jgi:DNA-directed RNA polymerase subunit RPC12/RpoP
MAEFKFSCPQCGQKILCDTGYAGSQINCPSCRQPVFVPPPQAAAAPVGRAVQVKASKSSTLRNILIAASSAVVLAAGVVAVLHYGIGDSTRIIWKNWPALDGDKSQWNFSNGEISGHSTAGESTLASPQKYGDVTFSATLHTANREATLAIRLQDKESGYFIVFAPDGTPFLGNRGYIALIKKSSGVSSRLDTYTKKNMASIGQTAKIKVVARGPLIEVWVNGTKLLHARDSVFATGNIGIRVYGNPNYPCDATFSKVRFK